MGKFEHARIWKGQAKRMKIRYMNDLKIPIDKNFTGQISVYVPQADIQKPAPKVAMTISVGADSIRIVGDMPEDLLNYLATAYAFVESEKESLREAVEKSKEIYYLQQREKEQEFQRQKNLRAMADENGTIPLITKKKAG
jgi:hypothetical protein